MLIAVVARDAESGPMWTMTGSEALRRAERLVHGIGGSLTRGFQDGEMLFGIGIPVEDDREDGDE
ncbi:hypothetical protein [Sphingomonas melonis]|uniref:hypothetical protein n=1 Tax=Sphingomonas melonis TaxID=152682 RepID=UPI000870DD71|nr:hypothetical protein [Sphingomonas melonis]AOW25307.1 hypothetical protein BJP26_18615 [Sphingomonas melonis TY]